MMKILTQILTLLVTLFFTHVSEAKEAPKDGTATVKIVHFGVEEFMLSGNSIYWEAKESNLKGMYFVQFSPNGLQFKTIGERTFEGNGNLHSYSYLVEDEGYYRILSVDANGQETITSSIHYEEAESQIQLINYASEKELLVQGCKDQVSYKIVNRAAKEIRQGVLKSDKNTISTMNLLPGDYFLRISGRSFLFHVD